MATITKYKTLPTEILHQLKEAGNNICSVCSDNSRRILVHHKDTNRFNQDSDNLQLVCSPCHIKIHQDIRQYKKKRAPVLVFIRLTPEEKHLLVEQSQKAGISMSALVRLMLSQYSNKDLSFS